MNATATQPFSATSSAAAFDAFARRATAGASGADASKPGDLRALVGEFVGDVFYGTLLRQMSQSTLKGKYMHGGRGEEVFQSQLHMEFAKRLGRAPGDPIADRIYESMTRGSSGKRAAGETTATSETKGAAK